MSKFNSLKDSVSGGLNGILSATGRQPGAAPGTPAPTKRDSEPAVHCNFLIGKSIHRRLKILAAEKNVSMRELVHEAMSEFLAKNGG